MKTFALTEYEPPMLTSIINCVARLSLTVLALSKKNSNAIEILTFLHKLADVSCAIAYDAFASNEHWLMGAREYQTGPR